MKINEVETLLGISKANIRFYEKEKLLTPQRSENGYRDYDESDIERLRKIIIFRKLGMGIPDIRDVLSGKRELGAALDDTMQALQRQMDELNGAVELCTAMRRDIAGENLQSDAYYWAFIHNREQQGAKFKALWNDYLALEKNVFIALWSGPFLINIRPLIQRRGWKIALLFALALCVIRGFAARFLWHRTFWYGFGYPFLLFTLLSAVLLPLFLLHRKYGVTPEEPPQSEHFSIKGRFWFSLLVLAGSVMLSAAGFFLYERYLLPYMGGAHRYIAISPIGAVSIFAAPLPFAIWMFLFTYDGLIEFGLFRTLLPGKIKKAVFVGTLAVYLLAFLLPLFCCNIITETGCRQWTILPRQSYSWEKLDHYTLGIASPDKTLSLILVMDDGAEIECMDGAFVISHQPEDSDSDDLVKDLVRLFAAKGIPLTVDNWDELESGLMKYWADYAEELRAIAGQSAIP